MRCMVSSVDTYTTICKIDAHWESAVCLRELKRALYQTRGVEGEGDGREVQEGGGIYLWPIHVDV